MLLSGKSFIDRKNNCEKPKRKNRKSAVSAVFTAGRDLAAKPLTASMTIEAVFVCSVVLFTLFSWISQAYRLHDTVTGCMILEEVLMKVRKADETEINKEISACEAYGEALGNPRLWLGEYEVSVTRKRGSVNGKAGAGDWEQEIQIRQFQPGSFLQRAELLKELGEEWTDDGSGIQEGIQSKLYGSAASGTEQ